MEQVLQVNKPRSFHVLGTDTDVGKSWVTSLFLECCLRIGHSALPVKPVHSGWPKDTTWGGDLAIHSPYLQDLTPQQLCAYALEAPMSPFGAAKLEGKTIEFEVLDHFWRQCHQLPADILVVEGIGGICCPLNRQRTYLEWLLRVPSPIILVARVGLGSLNTTIMSTRLLQSAGLPILAIVLNEEQTFACDDPIASSCREELMEMVDVPVLGPLKRDQRDQHLNQLLPHVEAWIS